MLQLPITIYLSQHLNVTSLKASHFGKPAQPYATESLVWLREKILGKTVYCKLLRKDQYSRIVSRS
jgi:endonuclease YncB( thermonuclease family)